MTGYHIFFALFLIDFAAMRKNIVLLLPVRIIESQQPSLSLSSNNSNATFQSSTLKNSSIGLPFWFLDFLI
jgi:hypothetical protein